LSELRDGRGVVIRSGVDGVGSGGGFFHTNGAVIE
jgi:hypothetical protein